MKETFNDTGVLSELFDAQPQAICWLTPVYDGAAVTDFAFTYYNDEWLRFLNISREEQENLLFSKMPTITDEMRQVFFDEMLQVLHTGQKVETNLYNPAINKYARVLRTRLRNGILTVAQDRTEENRIIEQLEAQKNMLDSILQHSPAGISVTKMIRDEAGKVIDGRTILANEPALKYTGLSEQDYAEKNTLELDPDFINSPIFQAALLTLQTGKPLFTQYYFAPGHRWLEMSIAKMDDDHLINVFMDVTATKEAQLRQQKLLDELQRSNQNLEEFAYAASHDLKEPIRKVLFFSDRLKHILHERLEPEALRLFGRLEAANKRMGNLVDDLLSYSQVSQRPELSQEVDLNKLMQIVLDDLELEIEERTAKVHIAQLATVKGHQRQLQQLFHNLVGNALKYCKPGTPPEINISCNIIAAQDADLVLSPEELKQQFYRIEVRDNGIGFEQKDAERIFAVFQRLHGNSEYRGTGVGLAIARKVAHNHAGYIKAESTPGAGATFKVFLPVSKS